MFKINGWSKNYSEKVYIYEEAAAQFSETLLFMALHDKFGFGMKRMEKIVKYWDDLPGDEDHIRSWLQIITEHGYNNEKMDRYYARKILPLASAGLLKRDKILARMYKEKIHNIILGAVVITYYILLTYFRFDADKLQAVTKRLYGYAFALRSEALGITIYDYMAVMKKECDISYDILEVYEKQNGKIRIGPKWGINSLTGKPRKRDESA